jgi:hypothetical protein
MVDGWRPGTRDELRLAVAVVAEAGWTGVFSLGSGILVGGRGERGEKRWLRHISVMAISQSALRKGVP